MTFPNPTSAAAAALAIVFFGAVVCPCPMPMAPVATESGHVHGCCPDEKPETSIETVDGDCCSDLPQIATAIVKKEQEVSVLAAEPFDLDTVPIVALLEERQEQRPVPPASPPLVLRI